MTTKDKTGDQLMASIRKTKTEAATSEPESAAAKTPAAAPKAKTATTPRKKAAAKAKPTTAQRAPASKKKVAAKPRVANKTVAKAGNAGYQSKGRVWPD